jgi:hypothetical protein
MLWLETLYAVETGGSFQRVKAAGGLI